MSRVNQITPLEHAEEYFDIDFSEVYESIHVQFVKDMTDVDVNPKFKKGMNDIFTDITNLITHLKVLGLMLIEEEEL